MTDGPVRRCMAMKNLGRVAKDGPGLKELYVMDDGSEWVVSTVNLDETLGASAFNRLVGGLAAAFVGTATSGEETGVFRSMMGSGKYDASHDGTLMIVNGDNSRQRALDKMLDMEKENR